MCFFQDQRCHHVCILTTSPVASINKLRGVLLQVIKKQLADGVSIRRVGLVSTGAPARQHSPILTMEGKEVKRCCTARALQQC